MGSWLQRVQLVVTASADWERDDSLGPSVAIETESTVSAETRTTQAQGEAGLVCVRDATAACRLEPLF